MTVSTLLYSFTSLKVIIPSKESSNDLAPESPWTIAGLIETFADGALLLRVLRISWSAAVESEVIMHICFGNFFKSSSLFMLNKPSLLSFSLRFSNCCIKFPAPAGSIVFTINW